MANWYTKGCWSLGSGDTVYSSATVKLLLVSSSYTFSKSHNFVSDITNEVTGGSYARQTLGSKTTTEDDANTRLEYDAADSTFTSVTFSNINAAVAFRDSGVAGTSPLLWYIDFSAQSPSAADVTLQFNSEGIAHFTA